MVLKKTCPKLNYFHDDIDDEFFLCHKNVMCIFALSDRILIENPCYYSTRPRCTNLYLCIGYLCDFLSFTCCILWLYMLTQLLDKTQNITYEHFQMADAI